jgi:hypothetical protein
VLENVAALGVKRQAGFVQALAQGVENAAQRGVAASSGMAP